MHLEKEEIKNLDRKYRLNLINSISGIKPANLIGTRSTDDEDNVAIFSSVVHLGSNPPTLGFIMRPLSDPPRDTYFNIQQTGYYTINHVSQAFAENAHYTSAKLEKDVSEFELMKLDKEFIDDFHAPFVKNSGVKMGLRHTESVSLSNGCTLVIGEVELIVFPDDAINDLGQLDLEAYECAGISGLNTYYSLKKLDSFPYVRVNDIPDFE